MLVVCIRVVAKPASFVTRRRDVQAREADQEQRNHDSPPFAVYGQLYRLLGEHDAAYLPKAIVPRKKYQIPRPK